MMNQVTRLDRVHKWNPDEIAPAKHPAELLVFDIPGREDCFFMKEVIRDVKELECVYQNHWRRDGPIQLILFRSKRQVHEDPKNQTGSGFAKQFDIEVADTRI